MKSVYLYSEILKMQMNGEGGAGCESHYVRISPTEGIKIIKYPRGSTDMYVNSHSPASYLASKNWQDVLRQVEIMNMLSPSRRAPKVYETMLVCDDTLIMPNTDAAEALSMQYRYYGAIRMEHIEHAQWGFWQSNTLPQQQRWNNGRMRWLKQASKRFRLTDTHEGNIVWIPKERRFMILDFGDVHLISG